MHTIIKRCSVIIIGLLLLSCVHFANDVGVNEMASENYEIFHRVDRISFFKALRVNDSLNTDGTDTSFLKIHIRNNTFDGFNVFLSPTNGVFKAQNTSVGSTSTGALSDGESDIPYTISVTKESGESGAGMTLGYNATAASGKFTWNASTVQQGVSDSEALQVYHMSGDSQLSPTDSVIAVLVTLDKAFTDRLGMSGRYTESISVTYVDL